MVSLYRKFHWEHAGYKANAAGEERGSQFVAVECDVHNYGRHEWDVHTHTQKYLIHKL